MKDFSISMALVDYIPVLFFSIASVLLMADLYNKMSKWAYALFSTGMISVTIAGTLKATYKLLYAAGICDFMALNNLFFPLQSIGFILAGIAMIAMLIQSNKQTTAAAVAPPVFSGTFVFVGLMVAGLGLMDVALCIISAKMKKAWLIVLFVLSFICSLCMGYLSSQDFAQASMNWIAEGVNVVGQGTLLCGVWLLHQNGLANYQMKKE